MEMEKKSPLRDLMDSTMEKVHEMVDANNIVGAPITTPDGVTLIPISRVSFGFGSGGGDYGKQGKNNFGGGGGACPALASRRPSFPFLLGCPSSQAGKVVSIPPSRG